MTFNNNDNWRRIPHRQESYSSSKFGCQEYE
jgi:hypothetical protein